MASLPANTPGGTTFNPTQPDVTLLPYIPPVPLNLPPDLSGLANMLDAMRQVTNQLSGARPASSEGSNPRRKNDGQADKNDSTSKKKNTPVRFQETQRVTEQVRIYNPQDHTQYVDILQINKLVMQDQVTGETWEWNR